MARVAVLLLLGASLLGASACGLDTGGDITTSSAGASSSASGTGAESAGGVSVGGQGGATSSGTGGVLEYEYDCYDGVDDDADGLVDCADPGCQEAGAACGAKPPSSAIAFVTLVPVDGECPPAATASEVIACGGCSCTLDDPGQCAATVSFHDGTDCADNEPIQIATGAMCVTNKAVKNGSTSAQNVAVAGSGTCTGAGSAAPTPMIACRFSVTAGGCDASQACAPLGACLAVPANAHCPVGFGEINLVSDDSRAGCDPCDECEVGELVCPAIAYQVFDDNNACSGGVTDVAAGVCTPMTVTSKISVQQTTPTTPTSAGCHGLATPTSGEVEKLCCP